MRLAQRPLRASPKSVSTEAGAIDPASRTGAAQALIGRGGIWHHRLRPVEHRFRHDCYFLLLPMRAGRARGWTVPRRSFGWITFADRDHGDGGGDALAWFESLLQTAGIENADGEIWLQTYPRVLGHVFKPVSFWYAHRADGSLVAIVAEVNNTFGERHCYLLDGERFESGGNPSGGNPSTSDPTNSDPTNSDLWDRDLQAEKVFHVSPFCSLEGHYRFRFKHAADRLVARIDLHDAHGPLLRTSLYGKTEPFTGRSARRAFWGTPLMTLGVVTRIHWHALRLFVKRVPFFHKPPAPERSVSR